MSEFLNGLDDPTIGSLGNCRTLQYYQALRQQIIEGRCPFCELDTGKNVVLRQFGRWRIWHNPYRYEFSKYHLVLAPTLHMTTVAEMSDEDWEMFGKLCFWAIREFRIPGGGIVMRFGDPNYNGSTLRHLHAHLQVPDRTGNVKATFAKDPSDTQKCRDRAIIFEKLTLGTQVEELNPSECLLIKGRLPNDLAERLETVIRASP